ncbi:MAG: hypothetical protein ACREJU_01445 [Nitrospiraceae bacterium]
MSGGCGRGGTWCFLVGADLIPQARTLRVRFAVPREERPEFLQRRTLSDGLPIAAQFEWDLTEADEEGAPQTQGRVATLLTVWTAPDAHGFSP